MSRAHPSLHPAALSLSFVDAAPSAFVFACDPKRVPQEFADAAR